MIKNFLRINLPAVFAALILVAACTSSKNISKIHAPSAFKGRFTDDYSINYSISDTLFLQEPNVKYHILIWDTTAKYIIAKNDAANPSEQNLYTRIDYMEFANMGDFKWGFCFTVFKGASAAAAEQSAAADRANPKKGCAGFPFSRMKRIP